MHYYKPGTMIVLLCRAAMVLLFYCMYVEKYAKRCHAWYMYVIQYKLHKIANCHLGPP